MNLAKVAPAESGPRKLPSPGWHPMQVIMAEATESAKGNSMIKVQVLLTAEEDDGYVVYDNFLTDGSAKGAGFSVPKLQGLGIDTNEEIPDEELADRLLQLEGFVKVKHEPIKDEDPRTGKYTIPRYDEDEKGRRVIAKRAVATGYSLQAPDNAQQVVSAPASAPPAPSQWQQPARPPPPSAPFQAPPVGSPSATPPWMQPNAGAPTPPPAPPVKTEAGATGGRGGGRKTK